jgi:hypothetical protein
LQNILKQLRANTRPTDMRRDQCGRINPNSHYLSSTAKTSSSV